MREIRTSIASTRAAALVFLTAGCSVVPDWSKPESREFRVTAHYAASESGRAVRLPISSENLLILALEAKPGDLEQTWHEANRQLVLPPGSKGVTVNCRYRVFREHGADGTPRPWPQPSELFPGASRIDQRQ